VRDSFASDSVSADLCVHLQIKYVLTEAQMHYTARRMVEEWYIYCTYHFKFMNVTG